MRVVAAPLRVPKGVVWVVFGGTGVRPHTGMPASSRPGGSAASSIGVPRLSLPPLPAFTGVVTRHIRGNDNIPRRLQQQGKQRSCDYVRELTLPHSHHVIPRDIVKTQLGHASAAGSAPRRTHAQAMCQQAVRHVQSQSHVS